MSKSKKMTKGEISVRFAELRTLSEQKNRQIKKAGGDVRFIVMEQKRKDRLQEFGLYDYLTKRYTLGNIHAANAVKAPWRNAENVGEGVMIDPLVPREHLEQNITELTEQLYGSYKRITQLNQRVEELEKENASLKSEIEALADERT